MELFLLNVMGSAAIASAVVVGTLATRLSREIAHAGDSRPKSRKPNRRADD